MTRKRSPVQVIGYGAVAGVIASLAMAMYAMIAGLGEGHRLLHRRCTTSHPCGLLRTR
jgi:hypothetical protein